MRILPAVFVLTLAMFQIGCETTSGPSSSAAPESRYLGLSYTVTRPEGEATPSDEIQMLLQKADDAASSASLHNRSAERRSSGYNSEGMQRLADQSEADWKSSRDEAINLVLQIRSLGYKANLNIASQYTRGKTSSGRNYFAD